MADKKQKTPNTLKNTQIDKDCEAVIRGIFTNFIDRAFGMDSVQYAVQSAMIESQTHKNQGEA